MYAELAEFYMWSMTPTSSPGKSATRMLIWPPATVFRPAEPGQAVDLPVESRDATENSCFRDRDFKSE